MKMFMQGCRFNFEAYAKNIKSEGDLVLFKIY